jgi:dUTP pyrophosphatase
MVVKFKKLIEGAQVPKFGRPGDAGADLVATSFSWKTPSQVVYGTGIAVEIPEGMVGLVFPRSSVRDYDLVMSNSVGVIDSGYRGEIMVTFNVNSLDPNFSKMYQVSDRIAQLVIVPVPFIQYREVEELSETQRSTKGHGSTGV